jgi:hypothetical protein
LLRRRLAAQLDIRITCFRGMKYMSRGPVAKERGRNDIRLGQFVEPESQAANHGRPPATRYYHGATGRGGRS